MAPIHLPNHQCHLFAVQEEYYEYRDMLLADLSLDVAALGPAFRDKDKAPGVHFSVPISAFTFLSQSLSQSPQA